MSITLTPDQEARLAMLVAAGDFATVEEAARALLDQKLADLESDQTDDLGWAKPLVDEARTAVERGDVITLEEHRTRTRQLLAKLR
jgi:antitoxin ParD1/3/4